MEWVAAFQFSYQGAGRNVWRSPGKLDAALLTRLLRWLSRGGHEALPFLYCLDQAVQEENVLPLLLFSFLLLPPSVQDEAELQRARRPHQNTSNMAGSEAPNPSWNGLFPPLVTRPPDRSREAGVSELEGSKMVPSVSH